MKLGKSIDAYVTLIERAWKTTWNHKEWWIIAAFAGLANTGGVFSSVFNTFWRLRPADTISTDNIVEIFPIVGWLLAYVRNLVALPANQQLWSVGLFALVIALALLIVVTCQHLLLSAIKKGHKKTQAFTRKNIKKDLSHLHISRLFAVDALLYILLTLLLTGTAIPLSLLLTDYVSINLFLYAGIYAIILPLAFVFNIVGMMTLIYISQHNLSFGKALHQGMLLIHRHWLSALEISLVLFFINLVASLIFFLCLFVATIAIGLLFEFAFMANAYLLMSFITFLGILLAGAIALIYAGAITMINYATWSAYAKQICQKRHTPIIEHVAQLAQKTFAR